MDGFFHLSSMIRSARGTRMSPLADLWQTGMSAPPEMQRQKKEGTGMSLRPFGADRNVCPTVFNAASAWTDYDALVAWPGGVMAAGIGVPHSGQRPVLARRS